jgi:hypothetical protein
MEPTRRSLLLSGAAASMLPRRAIAGGGSSNAPKYLIVVFADGGWDVTFSIDPKEPPGPGDDPLTWPVDGPWVDDIKGNEYQATLHGIPLQLNDASIGQDGRASVTEFFTNYGDRCCVINGIWTGSIVHQPSRIRMFTGTTRPDRADYATIIGSEKGFTSGEDLPLGTVDFSGLGYTGDLSATSGRIGFSSQLKSLLLKDSTFSPPSWADYVLPLYTPTTDEEKAIKQHLDARIAAYRREVSLQGFPHNDARLDDMEESYRRREMMVGKAEVIAGDLPLGERPTLSKQMEIAVELLKNGVCHTVTVASELVWDTHDINKLQHQRYYEFYDSMNVLADKLVAEGLLEQTLVVVMSEMTRTPKRNVKLGKDHWPHTSQIWFGAGVKGGSVVGASGEGEFMLEAQPIDLATGEPQSEENGGMLNKYDNLVAGLLCHMGIDHTAYLGTDVIPFTAASAHPNYTG